MSFRLLPRWLFRPSNLHDEPYWGASLPLKKEDRYGDDKTIHHTDVVDVEIGPDGEVCAVWFRCRMLPFTSNQVNATRALEMLKTTTGATPGIKAIVFDTQERRIA